MMTDTEYKMHEARQLKESIIQSIEEGQVNMVLNNNISFTIYSPRELRNMTLKQLQNLAKQRGLHYM